MSITRLRATLGDFNINKMDGFEVKKSVSKIIMVRAMKCNIINHKISPICLPNGRVPRIGNSGIVFGWVSHSKF